MLVCSAQSIAFIAVPKTGSTAVEMALRPHADIVFAKDRKHMTARKFHNRVAPFLKRAFGIEVERMAMMRDPEEQVRSWYRYRMRQDRDGDRRGTHGLSFDDFVRDVLRDDPPPHAGIGSQWNMLTGAEGQLLVHHLFAQEEPGLLGDFLQARFGKRIEIKRRNVSPAVPATLSDDTRAALRTARADEFALYDRLRAAGGHLVSSVD